MADATRLRVMGVSLPAVSDYRQPLPRGKWSQFFGALAERVDLVGIARPAMRRRDRAALLARHIHPDRGTWRARAGFDVAGVAKLDASLQRQLNARRDPADLIVQLQTLCSPRGAGVRGPYVIYTDNTMALTQRVYPRWAPLTVSGVDRWQRFEAGVCHEAARVFTFSEFARRSVIEDYGCPPDQVVAIGAGANQMVASVEGRDYTQRRALFVGHPFDLKGGPVLLEAWPLVRRRLPDAELVLAGPKTDPAPSFGEGVVWRGWLGREELAVLYQTSTAFVLPSMFDAWGHVLVEAMAHGLPCIGNDICAMPELIADGVSGRLVDRGDPEQLAAAIVEVLSDPETARRMGQAGHARALAELTWPAVIQRLMSSVAELGLAA